MLDREMQRKLWQSCDLEPSVDDCWQAQALKEQHGREIRRYKLGWLDDPMPNPILTLLGVLGIIIMRADGQQVFVPSALVTLRGCRCCERECGLPGDIRL